jgi:NAD(P) transhydrogenase subunit alpha
MVDGMSAGAVIVDLAAESGGNCELTEPGKTLRHKGITIDGPLNLASLAAIHASEMYSKNLLNLLELLVQNGQITINREDEVVAGCLLTHGGELVHAGMAKLLAQPG